MKELGALVPTPWHHDPTFWPGEAEQIVSLWMSLNAVSRATNGLQYVMGRAETLPSQSAAGRSRPDGLVTTWCTPLALPPRRSRLIMGSLRANISLDPFSRW